MALLRAELAFARSGWHAAASLWEQFAARAATLPETLWRRFASMHRPLFEAAAPYDPRAGSRDCAVSHSISIFCTLANNDTRRIRVSGRWETGRSFAVASRAAGAAP
jgi:hypothetical protein